MNMMNLPPTTPIRLLIPSNLSEVETDDWALASQLLFASNLSEVETYDRAFAMQWQSVFAYHRTAVETYDRAFAIQRRSVFAYHQPEVETDVSLLDDLNEVDRTDDPTGNLDNTVKNNTKVVINQNSVVNVDFPGWSVAKQQLQEIREEVEEAQALDSEIDPVPDSAYENAAQVLDKILVWGVSMPDIGWLIDGGIGFEWWSKDSKGIGTISIYGDNQVVYGASGEVSSRPIETKGTCPLSNFTSLNDFRTKLLILCSQ